jgi:hypothetical protein
MSHRFYSIKYLKATQLPDGSYIDPDGNIRWFNEEGEHHREDGPALIFHNAGVRWRLNGSNYSFNAWCEKINISDEHKLLLTLQYV